MLEEIKVEYKNAWDDLKEDTIITQDNFIYFFKDVSTCIKNDQDFVACLNSL